MSPLRRQRSQKTSPLVESLLTGDRAGVGGILCNDPNGLCLISKGNMDSDANSGAYTSLVRLASQLQPNQQQQNDTSPAPLITIETDETSILIKEYDGHTVAMRVPTAPEPKDQNDSE